MDFIEQYLIYTAGRPTPDLFRLWSGIACVAAALERRVWVRSKAGLAFPNLFTLLVAPPAIGKDIALDPTIDLWLATKGKIKVAPDSTTKASLLDQVEKSMDVRLLNGGGDIVRYHALAIGNPELGNLVNEYDAEFLSVLIALYNNKPTFQETRRVAKSVDLEKPTLNLIAGSQPAYLAHLLPEHAWGMGFMSRMVLVYSSTTPDVDIWDLTGDPEQDPMRTALVTGLLEMKEMYGEYELSPQCTAFFNKWKKTRFEPEPTHSRLSHYNARRGLIYLKLCMVAAASRTRELVLNLEDMERAQGWLLNVEQFMPDCFREMVGKSDSMVLTELHQYLWQISKGGTKPIHPARVWQFLGTRAPSDKVHRLAEVAERMGIIQRDAGTDLYRPRPKQEWGVE